MKNIWDAISIHRFTKQKLPKKFMYFNNFVIFMFVFHSHIFYYLWKIDGWLYFSFTFTIIVFTLSSQFNWSVFKIFAGHFCQSIVPYHSEYPTLSFFDAISSDCPDSNDPFMPEGRRQMDCSSIWTYCYSSETDFDNRTDRLSGKLIIAAVVRFHSHIRMLKSNNR